MSKAIKPAGGPTAHLQSDAQRCCLALMAMVALLPGVVTAGDVDKAVPDRVDTVVRAASSQLPPLQPRRPGGRRALLEYPYGLVSESSLLAYLEELTSIRPHTGWRSCGSRGEAEARTWVAGKLAQLAHLVSSGMEVQQTSFRTIAAMEMWETRLEIVIGGTSYDLPADAPTGDPYRVSRVAGFDSDGELTDSEHNPVVAEGLPLLLRTVEDVAALGQSSLADRVVFIDFALIDRTVVPTAEVVDRIMTLTGLTPAGLVAVVTNSTQNGDSYGSFAGDYSILNWAQTDPPMPILFTQVEEMQEAGVAGWDDLTAAESARLTWDTDIVTPGTSGNVIARIPGASSQQAVILSAHLDSANSPGALDNGSGSVSLLEVARVIDESGVQPAVDLYLVWFGCHERGMFGSPHFVATNQELLDRTVAVVELDALARPLDGISPLVNLESHSYSRFGDDSLPLAEYLQQNVLDLGIEPVLWDEDGMLADITSFIGWDVPHALLDNLNFDEMEGLVLHYAAHWHNPYDTIEMARDVADSLAALTRVMLAAALATGRDLPELRVTPAPGHRVLMVGTHTEAATMSPIGMTGLGTTLAWHGHDIDLVPYGEPLTAADLADADLVVVLPVSDYANQLGDLNAYDESWSAAEVDLLTAYVNGGGRLVLTNSGFRLWFSNLTLEYNEDWPDANAVGERFGVAYQTGPVTGDHATVVTQHPLVEGVTALWTAVDNAIPFIVPATATVLATSDGQPAVALVSAGEGELLVLSDLGMLGGSGDSANYRFWENLATWVSSGTR